jgi:PilZ domain
MLATAELLPGWIIWTSLTLAMAAAGLLIYAGRRSKPRAILPPQVVLPTSEEPPPPPPLAVAPMPLSPFNRAAERRVGYRRVGNPVEVLVCDAEFKSPPVRGWVVDRSRMGIRLSLTEKKENGTVLQVRPTASPESIAWQTVQIRNAQENEGTWEMGCQFTNEPSWEVLLLFG